MHANILPEGLERRQRFLSVLSHSLSTSDFTNSTVRRTCEFSGKSSGCVGFKTPPSKDAVIVCIGRTP
jgi:hypothetical protein